MSDLTIVVPVYNSASTLKAFTESLLKTFGDSSIEIILVNDNSSDDSWQVIRAMCSSYAMVYGINLAKNFGQHPATLCGISYSKSPWIATIDDDLEQSPESLKELYEHAKCNDYDVIYGIRSETSHTLYRRFFSGLGRVMLRTLIPGFSSNVSSVRIIRNNVAQEILKFHAPYPFIDGYLSWATNKISHFTIPNFPRLSGKSGYSVKKLFHVTLNIFFGFSDLLLKYAIIIGFSISILGIVGMIAIAVLRILSIITYPGYASVISLIFMLSGIQLFSLGVIGLYISRLIYITSKKPQYAVREAITSSD